MIKRLTISLMLPVVVASLAWSQTAVTNEQILKELQALRDAQKTMEKDIQEIKKLLSQQARPAADLLPKDPININKEPFKGAPNAKVALIEFSDFQCPFCGKYDKETFPQIEKDYIETGKIKYVWRDYPLDFHKQAFKAAEAAHCAGEQGKFWEMHARLFENQKNLGLEELPKHAETLQLNKESFQACLDSGRHAEAIKKDLADGATAGVSGTPTFLIGVVQPNGTVKVTKKLVGAKPYADFKAALDTLLTPAPPAGTN